MKIKLDIADKQFSWYIRLRDRKCVRCGSRVKLNEKGLPITHQASHYFGRGQESTRFDPANCDTLCMACHIYWGSKHREDYRQFKIRQLGEDGFNALLIKSKTLVKKDRKLARIITKELYQKELENN